MVDFYRLQVLSSQSLTGKMTVGLLVKELSRREDVYVVKYVARLDSPDV